VVSFKLRCVAKIWRRYADIGGKMAVSVMVAYPDGAINSYAFMQGEKAVVDSASVLLGKTPETVEVKAGAEGTATEEGMAGDSAAGGFGETTTEASGTSATETKSDAGGFEGFNFEGFSFD